LLLYVLLNASNWLTNASSCPWRMAADECLSGHSFGSRRTETHEINTSIAHERNTKHAHHLGRHAYVQPLCASLERYRL